MSIFSRTSFSAPPQKEELHPEFGKITFIRTKRSHSLRLKVKPFQGILASLPPGFSHKKALAFIENNQTWIRQALNQARQTEEISRQFFLTQPTPPLAVIRESLKTRLNELANQHGFNYNKLSIRNQKSRWGSCSGNNNISLNQKIFYLPNHLRDYVLLHELAHTQQKNHSNKFWDILDQIIGKQNTRQARKELRTFEFLFYPPPTPK